METLTICPTSTATILACQRIAKSFKCITNFLKYPYNFNNCPAFGKNGDIAWSVLI